MIYNNLPNYLQSKVLHLNIRSGENDSQNMDISGEVEGHHVDTAPMNQMPQNNQSPNNKGKQKCKQGTKCPLLKQESAKISIQIVKMA